MSDWMEKSLRKLLHSTFAGEWGENPHPYNAKVLRATDITDDMRVNLEGGAPRLISKTKLEEKKLIDGDIILEGSGGSIEKPVGRVAYFDATKVKNETFLVSNFFRTLRPNKNVVEPRFLFWLLNWFYKQPALRSMQQQTTGIINLKLQQYLDTLHYLPECRTEQSTIAKILDTLDSQILETEAIIVKLQKVKQGLLHDLLTRGVDENGELRPSYEDAPELYKPSELGWIPKEWDVEKIENLLSSSSPAMRSGPFGSALLKSELVEKGLPLLGIDNVFREYFCTDYRRFVSPEKFDELSRYAVKENDLMITIMGTVGRCCLVPKGVGKALSSKHTWCISLDQNKYSPYLAMLQINYSSWVLKHFSSDQQGGTMDAIRSETLRATLFPKPQMNEQLHIEKILKESSKRLYDESRKLNKLKLKKSGLMDDLLTGKVCVTELLKQKQAS